MLRKNINQSLCDGESELNFKNIFEIFISILAKTGRHSIEEEEVLEETVARHYQEETYPSLRECSYLIETNKVLSARSPVALKTHIYNV